MPGTPNLATQLASAEYWYVHSEGGTFGPFTPAQMEELGLQGRLGPQTLVVPAGNANWFPLQRYIPAEPTIRTPTSAELSELVGVASLNSSSSTESGPVEKDE
jgi:GYF domain 2